MSRLNCLTVKVERATGNPRSPFVKLFDRPIQIDSNVSVPYETLIRLVSLLIRNTLSKVLFLRNYVKLQMMFNLILRIMKNKTFRVVLEIIKLIVTFLLGYNVCDIL